MRVIDGMHRLRAAELQGCDRIDVDYFDGSEEEAIARAVELNVAHGLPLRQPWGIADPVFAPFTLAYPASTLAALTAYWVTYTRTVLAFEAAHRRHACGCGPRT